jgi:hypothetical protein
MESAPTSRQNETSRPGVIAVQNVQETNLAWALIEVVKPHLNVVERNYVFVTTGAGDTFAAIHQLLKVDCCQENPAAAQSAAPVRNMARLICFA